MRVTRVGWTVVLSLVLASCGGSGSSPPPLEGVDAVNAVSPAPRQGPAGGFNQLVAFGDSLSDDGAYTLAAVLNDMVHGNRHPFSGWPYAWGGQFSVNGGPDPINWTDQLAASLGLKLTPNLVQYGVSDISADGLLYLDDRGQPSTDLAASLCAFGRGTTLNCTNFAQGGARVSSDDGIGHQPDPVTGTFAPTLSLRRQIDSYQNQFGGFKDRQLVTVLGGANDVLIAAQAVQQAGQGLPPDQQRQARARQLLQSRADVDQAADDLAAQTSRILQQGARYLMVVSLPDIGLTPMGQDWRSGRGCDVRDGDADCFVLSALSKAFNRRLSHDLLGLPVVMSDGARLFERMLLDPQAFGLVHVKQPWCDPGPDPTLPTSSLLCNRDTPNRDVGADASHLSEWLFADALHPAPRAQQAVSDSVHQSLQRFGWI